MADPVEQSADPFGGIIGAGVGAVGQLLGGLLGSKTPKGALYRNQPGQVSADQNPLFQAMQLMAMLGQGQQITPGMMNQNSPLAALLSQVQNAAIKRKGQRGATNLIGDIRGVIQQGIADGLSPEAIASSLEAQIAGGLGKDTHFGPGRAQRVLDRLMGAAGYGSLSDLVKAEMDFQATAGERTGRYNETAAQTEAGRLAALQNIARIQQDFVAPSASDITSAASEQEAILRAQIARERADQMSALMEQASAAGINPAARLGRLDEWQAQSNMEAGTAGLQRALQLLGGRQGLQTSALGALQGSLNAADQTPLALSQLQSGNQVGLGQIAAQQAMNLAGIQQQGNQFLGSGIANAGNTAMQAMLLPLIMNQGGTAGMGGLVGGQAAAPFNPGYGYNPATAGLDY